jgi:hypothetical protein
MRPQGGRVRILSIGRPLAHRAIDNHTIFNAPAVFDYDAIVIDPAGVFTSIREAIDGTTAHQTLGRAPVVNGAGGAGVPIAEVLLNRRDEFVRALERGAVVAVFTQPQGQLTDVIGFPGCDRYFFLPAPPGVAWDARTIRWGEGAAAVPVDPRHPFTPLVETVGREVQYRAHFDERAEGIAAARIFARSTGGAPVGVEFSVLGGRVVFLPAPGALSPERRREMGAALALAMREALGRGDPDEQPSWVEDHSLPGLIERQAAAADAAQKLDGAQLALAEAERSLRELAEVRDVLWRDGRYGLLPAVVRCMKLIGFAVNGEEDEQPVLRAAEGILLLEAEGANGAVGMPPHYRLRHRLDAQLEKDKRAPRGVIVVNGDRLRDPAERERQVEDVLRIGAESTRYGLLTASELFEAARAALAGADAATLASIRRRLIETDGVVSLADLLGEGARG